mmetsp:Transcript_26184/g.81513  ORF Transcript_26184/g.81513 Transcript_26184/m.81513 type:complete len:237 (+) Transcript_26184:3947-4657(+)
MNSSMTVSVMKSRPHFLKTCWSSVGSSWPSPLMSTELKMDFSCSTDVKSKCEAPAGTSTDERFWSGANLTFEEEDDASSGSSGATLATDSADGASSTARGGPGSFFWVVRRRRPVLLAPNVVRPATTYGRVLRPWFWSSPPPSWASATQFRRDTRSSTYSPKSPWSASRARWSPGSVSRSSTCVEIRVRRETGAPSSMIFAALDRRRRPPRARGNSSARAAKYLADSGTRPPSAAS